MSWRLSRSRVVLGFASLLIAVLLALTWSGAAASTGPAICAQAVAEAGTGQGRFGDFDLVYAPASGGSGSQVVVGTDGGDVLEGGSGADVLCGYGGDDTLRGGSGSDIIVSGSGTNSIAGGSGADVIHAVASDTVDGGSGANTVTRVGGGLGAARPTVSITVQPLSGTTCDVTHTVTGLGSGTFFELAVQWRQSTGKAGSSTFADNALSNGTLNGTRVGLLPADVLVESVAVVVNGGVVASATTSQVCGNFGTVAFTYATQPLNGQDGCGVALRITNLPRNSLFEVQIDYQAPVIGQSTAVFNDQALIDFGFDGIVNRLLPPGATPTRATLIVDGLVVNTAGGSSICQ